MKHLLASAVTLGLFCTAAPAMAEVDRTADTVVVTAGRVAESQKNVTQQMTVITSEEIEKNQYDDMADLLQANGFQMNAYSPNQATSEVVIRGIRSGGTDSLDALTADVLVLVDGRPLATGNLGAVPMAGIAQVEIIRGPAAVQYGSSAVGGVINVITKRGGEEMQGMIEVGAGSWESYRFMSGLSGSGGPVDFAGAVSYVNQNDDYTTSGGKTYPDTAIGGKLDYMLNLGYNFLDEHRIGVLLLGSDNNKLGLNDGFSYYQQEYRKDWIGGSNKAKLENTNLSFDINYEGGYSPSGINWQVRYYNAKNKYDTLYDYATSNEIDWTGNNKINEPDDNYRSELKMQGVQVQTSWKWNFFSLTGGLDWNDAEYSTRTPAGGGITNVYDRENIGAFLLAKVFLLNEKLVLSGGVRYDEYDVEMNTGSKTFDNTVFSAGIVYNPLDWLTLRGNIGESFKVPSGLHVLGFSGNGWSYIAAPDLDPEEGFGWDIGAEINYNGFNAGLTYFSNDIKNKIDGSGMTPSYEYYYVNLPGKSKLRGIEGQLSVDLGQLFEWDFMLRPYLNFTHLFTYEDPKGKKLPKIREWMAAFGVAYDHPGIGLDVDLRFTYLGEDVVNNSYGVPWAGPTLTSVNTGDVVITDFFISKVIMDFEDKGKLSLKGEIRNLFDVDYEYVWDYPSPGRSFYIGLRYDYN